MRTANLFEGNKEEATFVKAWFLCQQLSTKLLAYLAPELDEQVTLPLPEKMAAVGKEPGDIFKFTTELSTEINAQEFALSFLKQPKVYLRVRPGKQSKVAATLKEAGVDFEELDANCISVANGAAVSQLKSINKDFVVQDKLSQQVLNYLKDAALFAPVTAWDCCAASGGKSILLKDVLGFAPILTISDLRPAILENSKTRLQQAGVAVDSFLTIDLTKNSGDNNLEYNVIVCDAPCTGSGTWARTPEQLYFFKPAMIGDYKQKQISIATNAMKKLAAGGLFFYITCSVFKAENEGVVAQLTASGEYECRMQQYYKGYSEQADTLYVAVLCRK